MSLFSLTDGFGSQTAIPTASKRMNQLVAMIRGYMRDRPELNRLIAGEETNDRLIAWAVIDVIEDWNTTPPFLAPISLSNIPSVSILRDAITARILESAAMLQMRNHLNFNDGGISVSVSDKAPQYLNFAQYLWNRYEQKKGAFKSSQNIELAMEGSGVPSEYFLINSSYVPW